MRNANRQRYRKRTLRDKWEDMWYDSGNVLFPIIVFAIFVFVLTLVALGVKSDNVKQGCRDRQALVWVNQGGDPATAYDYARVQCRNGKDVGDG